MTYKADMERAKTFRYANAKVALELNTIPAGALLKIKYDYTSRPGRKNQFHMYEAILPLRNCVPVRKIRVADFELENFR